MCGCKSRKWSIKVFFILTISVSLLTLSCCNANSPQDMVVNVTTAEKEVVKSEMETPPPHHQGSVVDATTTKITENPNLDKIDETHSKCRGINIREITILQLQNFYKSGQLSAVELTKCYLERLEQMNPVLRTVIQVNPDALKDALNLDQELESGNSRGPMHGIPVLLKDGIGTKGLTETTAGSLALVGIRPKKDAEVVAALRKAGAIILGKANLSEFYWLRGSNIPNGWSGRGGQTRNAYNLNVTPEGSSSGSAVAVSANLCAVSLGTETDGSLTAPASLAGICSMKPTFGLVSVKGIIPVSHNQDYVGPMARTVTDLSILLNAMIPADARPSQHPQSYTEFMLDTSTTRPFRIGVVRHPFWDPSVINSTNLRDQLPKLEKLLQIMNNSSSFEMMDPLEITEKDLFNQISIAKELIMLQHDLKYGVNEYLKNEVDYPTDISSDPSGNAPRRKNISSLKDIIQFNEEHPTPEGYNQEYLIKSEATDGLLNETYIDARDGNRAAAKKLLDSILDKYNLDALVTPSDPTIEGISEKSFEDFPPFGFSMACMSGYPSVNIPAGIGWNDSPFGMMFVGKPYSEPTLLKIAYTVEQLSPQRVPPKFLI